MQGELPAQYSLECRTHPLDHASLKHLMGQSLPSTASEIFKGLASHQMLETDVLCWIRITPDVAGHLTVLGYCCR